MAAYNILIEKDGDGFYVSEVVELPGCHTQAKTLDELMKRTREAILLYLKCEGPVVIESSDFVGLQKIEV